MVGLGHGASRRKEGGIQDGGAVRDCRYKWKWLWCSLIFR